MEAKALNLQFRKARLEHGSHPVANVGSSSSEKQATTSSKMKTHLRSLSYRGGSHECKPVVERQIPERQSHGPFGRLGEAITEAWTNGHPTFSTSPIKMEREERDTKIIPCLLFLPSSFKERRDGRWVLPQKEKLNAINIHLEVEKPWEDSTVVRSFALNLLGVNFSGEGVQEAFLPERDHEWRAGGKEAVLRDSWVE